MSHIIFDFETAPQEKEKLASMMPEFNPEEVKCGNTKDPEKIAAKIARAKLDHEENFYRRAALSAVSGRLLVAGMMLEDNAFEILEGPEERILHQFWSIWDLRHPCRFIGFNCKAFDILFAVRRSWILGVPIPFDVMHGKYQSERIVDLYEMWMVGNRKPSDEKADLNTVCKALGVGEKSGHGAEFSNKYITDRPAALEYLKNDLTITRNAARKMGVIA